MQLEHVIYKAKDLPRITANFEVRGFAVGYGTTKRPYNTFIYSFSGPYLELLARTGMSSPPGRLLAPGPCRGAARCFLLWDRGPKRACGLYLEGDVSELEEGRTLLSGRDLCLKPRRMDSHGRELYYEVSFPDDVDLSLLVSCFSIDSRPRNLTHPNGIGSIAHVTHLIPRRK